jgi:dehydrogenase/reductase SDR family member 12
MILLDTLMDRTLIGYSRVGYRIRSRGWSESDLDGMAGRVVLVTGATSGIGLAAAEGFARLGATVWLGVRDPHRGEEARARIVAAVGNPDVHVAVCDLSSLKLVREFARQFRSHTPRLDVLVNNAGVLASERELSADGIELTLATNVIGPFLLTGLLTPLLQETSPARIVNVSSGGMYAEKIRTDDLEFAHERFNGTTAYARSKRAQVILSQMWAERLAGRGVVVHAMHPGWVDTPGLRTSLPRFYRASRAVLRAPEQGADTIVWLGAAAAPGRTSGELWHDRTRRPTHVLPWTRESEEDRIELWAQCVRLSGLELESA